MWQFIIPYDININIMVTLFDSFFLMILLAYFVAELVSQFGYPFESISGYDGLEYFDYSIYTWKFNLPCIIPYFLSYIHISDPF